MSEQHNSKRSRSIDEDAVKEKCSNTVFFHGERYVVLEFFREQYTTKKGSSAIQLSVRMNHESSGHHHTLLLRDRWAFLPLHVGDIVNIIHRNDGKVIESQDTTVIDGSVKADGENDPVLVVNPHILVSPTAVSESLSCTRRAVLSQRVQRTGINVVMLMGAMAHTLFERALVSKDFTTRNLHNLIQGLVGENVVDLFAVGLNEEECILHLVDLIKPLQQWTSMHIPKMTNSIASPARGAEDTIIDAIHSVEEPIISPSFGLNGVLDATVQATMGSVQVSVMPFELKSSKKTTPSSTHQAQVAIYAVMLQERYGVEVPFGLLYYMPTSTLSLIRVGWKEVKDVIYTRNELVSSLSMQEKLPELKRQPFFCRSCSALETCMVYHKAFENGTEDTSGIGNTFSDVTGHLAQSHLDFFIKWNRLIDLELGLAERTKYKLWADYHNQNEESKRSLRMVLINTIHEAGDKFRLVFEKSTSNLKQRGRQFPEQDEALSSTFESNLSVGEKIILNQNDFRMVVFTGNVTSISSASVVVSLRINKNSMYLSSEKEQPDVEDLSQTFLDSQIQNSWRVFENRLIKIGTTWTLHKEETTFSFASAKDNILRLLSSEGDETLRGLIVDRHAPSFTSPLHPLVVQGLESPELNAAQVKSLKHVFSADHYAMILGMPGTGKTTTISKIIELMVQTGNKVLVTSYTHTAVDNILLKLKECEIPFVRFGRSAQVHPEIKEFVLEGREDIGSVEALSGFLHQHQVIATTCLSAKQAIFNQIQFDYCIVDEASQISLPVSLAPIFLAKRFILVGDHYQLPPLIRNEEAVEEGMGESLFKYLTEAHPEALVELQIQYRMNEDIMTFSNELIYDHRLRCGSEAVSTASLQIPKPYSVADSLHLPVMDCEWLQLLMESERRVVFLDTDNIPGLEERKGNSIKNDVEAILVAQVMMRGGIRADQIGVISPYHRQLDNIRSHLISPESQAVEIETVDRYQGRDKDCIILSFVRSNENKRVGSLLRDWRRINVAITRAKRKLILIGSRSTLLGQPLLARLVSICEQKNWVITLPPAAHLSSIHRGTQDLQQTQAEPQADLAELLGFDIQPSDLDFDETAFS